MTSREYEHLRGVIVARYNADIAALERVRELLNGCRESDRNPSLKGGGTLVSRIVNHFGSIANEWQSPKQIMEVMVAKRNAVTNVLYGSHKDRFESRTATNGPRKRSREFRLRMPC